MAEFKSIINYIKKNIFYIVIIIFGVHFIYFKSNIGSNPKIKTLISIYGISAIGLLLSMFGAYNASKINYVNTINNQISYLNQLFQNITQSISAFFINNKNMRYFYDELYNNIENTDETIRDKNLEQVLTNNILINVDALINYIDSFKITSGTNFQIKVMEEKLLKLLKQFMRSKIFVENWKKFRSTIALKWTIDYMELHFKE